MASGELDPQIYKRTRDTLGKIIKKPPLNDKFLARPPFRFLRDVILEISRTTTFFKGLYSGKELDTKSEWDRDTKTMFLQKAIDVVAFTTGNTVKARPSKIVAGLEADKTNEFLQMTGIAILKKLDSSEAIKKVLKGERPTHPGDKKKSKGTEGKKRHEEKKEKGKEKVETPNPVQEEEEKENSNDQPLPPPPERPPNRPTTRRKTREAPAQAKEGEDEVGTSAHKEKGEEDHLSSGGSGSQVKLPERPTSAKGGRKMSQDRQDTTTPPPPSLDKHLEETSQVLEEGITNQSPLPPLNSIPNGLVPFNTRPSSARPPAPRVVTRVADTEDNNSRNSSGHDRVPLNVIPDKEEEKEEDDEFVVQNSNLPLPPLTGGEIRPNEDQTNTKPEGALAKTLLETKERFVGEEGTSSKEAHARNVSIDEAQRKREREGVEKEVKTLQGSIQSLCQSANPLGKMMDYVQEDLDSMYQELEMWRKENSGHADALRREEKITEEELTPLQSQLAELEEKVNEQFDLISNMKVTIMKNEEQVKNLVMSSH